MIEMEEKTLKFVSSQQSDPAVLDVVACHEVSLFIHQLRIGDVILVFSALVMISF